MNHTITADELTCTVRDTVIAEFMIRQLCLTVAHHPTTRRETARLLEHKITSQTHFYTAVELRLMQAIADALSVED